MSLATTLAPLTAVQLALPASGGSGGAATAAAGAGGAGGEPAASDFARALGAAGAAPAAGAGMSADDSGTAAGPRPKDVEPTLRPAVRTPVHESPATRVSAQDAAVPALVATAASVAPPATPETAGTSDRLATRAKPAAAAVPATPASTALRADPATAADPTQASGTHAAAQAVHAFLPAAPALARANRPAQSAATVSAHKGPTTTHVTGSTTPDGESLQATPADHQPLSPDVAQAPTSATWIGGDPATLLAELRARHPPHDAAPDPSALARRDSDATAAAALRPVRRPPTLAAVQSPSPAVEPAAVLPPRQASTSAIDALPSAGGAAADNAYAPPPALSPAGLSQPVLAPPAVPAAAAATPVAEAHLPAAPGSAEFTAQLGAQLTTFVRDGVQHARLHLNPAELGPVTVQIQLDGQSAQVHLAAEHGFTRQALEQSMPLLAGSLREAGLTLSGGGVFEQPRQPREGAPGPPDAGRRGDATGADPTPRPATAAVRRRGVVDLIA